VEPAGAGTLRGDAVQGHRVPLAAGQLAERGHQRLAGGGVTEAAGRGEVVAADAEREGGALHGGVAGRPGGVGEQHGAVGAEQHRRRGQRVDDRFHPHGVVRRSHRHASSRARAAPSLAPLLSHHRTRRAGC